MIRVVSAVLLAACATASQSIGRAESYTVQGVTLDVFVVDAPFAVGEAATHINSALRRRGLAIDSSASTRNRIVARSARRLTCDAAPSGAPGTTAPCSLGVTVAYSAAANGTEVRLAGIEYLSVGGASGSQQLRVQSRNWKELEELARNIVAAR